jgi:hypothetical protein
MLTSTAGTTAQLSRWWTRLNTPALSGSNTWYGAASNNGTFVIVGGLDNTGAYSTTGGSTWTASTLPTINFFSVIYGADKFVAVGPLGAGAYSTDGITWTSSTMPALVAFNGVAYGASGYVAVGTTSAGNPTTTYATSGDGISWTSRTFSNGAYSCITYGNGNYVAWTNSGTAYVSSDGISWTSQSGLTNSVNAVTYGNGYYVAVSQNGTITWSTNGSSWSTTSAYATQTWDSIAFGNGRFVITGINTNQALWSETGTSTWYDTTLPGGISNVSWLAPAYGTVASQPRWICAGYYFTGPGYTSTIAISTDGQTWY